MAIVNVVWYVLVNTHRVWYALVTVWSPCVVRIGDRVVTVCGTHW